MAFSALRSVGFESCCGGSAPVWNDGTLYVQDWDRTDALGSMSRGLNINVTHPASQPEKPLHIGEDTICQESSAAETATLELQQDLLKLVSQQAKMLQDLANQWENSKVQLEIIECQIGNLPAVLSRELRRVIVNGQDTNVLGRPSQDMRPEAARKKEVQILEQHEVEEVKEARHVLHLMDAAQVHPNSLQENGHESGESTRAASSHNQAFMKCAQEGAAHTASTGENTGVVPATHTRSSKNDLARNSSGKELLMASRQRIRRTVATRRKSSCTANESELFPAKSLSKAGHAVCQTGCARAMVTHPVFDRLCAAVIAFNAALYGWICQDMITFCITHPGEGLPTDDTKRIIETCFSAFFIFEMILKLLVLQGDFFTQSNLKWNVFDLVLVASCTFDMIAESADWSVQNTDLLWLRVLKVNKMMRMLRVVHVMRFFHELRTIMGSIMSSFTTLLWSCLLLVLTAYIFCLIFVQATSSYIAETDLENIPSDTFEGIQDYWSSVPQAMLTLYYAITGGSDWEVLAAPIRTVGTLYFLTFLAYVCFMTFAVLNVVTGLFVDKVVTASGVDDEEVLQVVVHFVENFANDGTMEDAVLSWDHLEQHIDDPVVTCFIKVLHLTRHDLEHIFALLDTRGHDLVNLEDFVASCMHAQGDVTKLELVFLTTETKQLTLKVDALSCALAETTRKLPSGAADT